MSYEIRPITKDEFPAFVEADSIAFGYTPDDAETARMLEYMEMDRTLAAFDGDELVGTTCIFSFDMTVPGGSLPTAGVSWVSVKPTHTRRGILRAMMRRQLDDVRERGEPMAALWASESLIYGRFGYGLAAQNARLKIERRRAAIEHDIPARGRTRLVDRDEALARWPECYERARILHPGMISRSPVWWANRHVPDKKPEGGRRRILAQYEEDGIIRGFARYEWTMNWSSSPNNPVQLHLHDLVAETPEAYTALWKLVLATDLVDEIVGFWRPPEEPLYHMLEDPRRMEQRLGDSLWIRIVDVPRALEGRRYARDGKVTFEVREGFCEWAGGTFTLEGGPEGARCSPAKEAPAFTIGAAELGAIFLGGTRLATLASAGRVEGDGDAIALADAMFAWHPRPYCPEVF